MRTTEKKERSTETAKKNLMVVCAGREGGNGNVHCRWNAYRERKKDRGKGYRVRVEGRKNRGKARV